MWPRYRVRRRRRGIGDAEELAVKVSPSLQINPLTELLVKLGVMVACPGKERLVKVGARGRDAKDAGNFDAYKLQCRQLVDGSEGKRGRGLLEQIAAALQRVATSARVAERRGFGGSRAYGLVAAALRKIVADLARHAANSGHDGECVGVGRVDGNVPGFVGRVRDGDAFVVIGSIGNAEGRDRGLFVSLPALALAQC